MTAHAILGASSAYRWVECPGSIREIEALPAWKRNRTSRYAEEGTAAHTLAAWMLIWHGPTEGAGQYLGQWVGHEEGPHSEEKPGDFEVTEEMVAAVDLYAAEVHRHIARLSGAPLQVEVKVVPIADLAERMYGTADAVVFDTLTGELVVLDFKYGAGHRVESDWNLQTAIYALGAAQKVGMPYVEMVRTTIVQPRSQQDDEGPVREFVWTAADLSRFEVSLRAHAAKTADQAAPLHAGDWCGWCPAVTDCPAVNKIVYEQALQDFTPLTLPENAVVRLPDPEDVAQMERAMRLLPVLQLFVTEVPRRLQAALEGGAVSEHFKLVRTVRHRRWIDEEKTKAVLKNKAGVKVDDFLQSKLRSPAQLERIEAIGSAWVERYAEKPLGNIALAPITDRRPAVDPPLLTDFTPVDPLD